MNLQKFSTQIRIETLKMLKQRQFGHIGGSLSIVEALAVIYGKHLHIDPKNPNLEDRDYFVLSKGHAGPALYATLALKGFFDKELLMTLNENGTTLPSHADRLLTPGIDMTTGSLGQGISVATGIAKAFKIKNSKQKVYCVVGDGELNEGQCWEAIQFASHQKLDNFVLLVDENKKQLDGYTTDVSNLSNLETILQSFGMDAIRVKGDDVDAIDKALSAPTNNKPKALILDTIKGQGVKHFEELFDNHHVRFLENDMQKIDAAITELEGLL